MGNGDLKAGQAGREDYALHGTERGRATQNMSETPDPDLVSAPDDCRRQVAELVERFHRNRDQYRSAA